MKTTFTLLLFSIFASISLGQNNSGQITKKNETYFKFQSNVTKEDYLPQTIIFKIKPEYRHLCNNYRIENPSLNKILSELDVVSLEKKFPGKKDPGRATNERGEKLVDLSLIYKLSYSSAMDLEKAINYIYSSGIIEYAEPHYIPRAFYTSNDPRNGMVYALAKMKVFDAWDISQGDTNVVIGITDTGVDFEHLDLKNNIKYNYNDPINGIDDDGDSCVDNFRGWDVGDNDNNPQYDNNPHGVHVSGTAAASADNAIGVSGVGFKCKFLPIKNANFQGILTNAYESIVYAADHGCQIINCSWGGTGGGQFGQDVVNYATFNKNSLVVCAAGNNNNQEIFYPAFYNNAFTVASTGNTDRKSDFSNFGYHVDVSAPGSRIFSTVPGNNYGFMDGTSMSAPNVAGAAAIVKSRFPHYSALQVGEQLKVTADDISSLNSNTYIGKLGMGRINLYRALTDTTSPSVVMTERTIGNISPFNIDDTLKISGAFTNYLVPTGNISAVLSSSSNYIKILNDSLMLGVISTLETVNNNDHPFKVMIKLDTPNNFIAPFILTLSDGTYSTKIYFDVNFNIPTDYINIAINDIATSINSTGRIGYNKGNGINGLGFTYMGGSSILYEAGLMIGNSEGVSSAVKGTTPNNNDFSSSVKIRKTPSATSNYDAKGSFNDNNAANSLNVKVNQSAFAWNSVGNRKFIIITYNIKNSGTNILNNLYAGIFADWNIMDYTLNKADFDAINQMGYVWSTQNKGLYAGVKLLSTTASARHYAIDNVAGGSGGLDMTDGFDIQEKLITLSTNRIQAGITSGGTDVISVVSSGPYDLFPGDSAIVAFALLAGDSLEDLQASAVAAQDKYDMEISPLHVLSLKQAEGLWLGQAYPNPALDKVTLEFILPQAAQVKLSIYNALGQEVLVPLNKPMEKGKYSISADVNTFAKGIYLYKLTADDISINGKMTVAGFNH